MISIESNALLHVQTFTFLILSEIPDGSESRFPCNHLQSPCEQVVAIPGPILKPILLQ